MAAPPASMAAATTMASTVEFEPARPVLADLPKEPKRRVVGDPAGAHLPFCDTDGIATMYVL